MKKDSFQDKKNPSHMHQSENSSSDHDDSLDWAKEAYLQLKQKQNVEKLRREKEITEQEILKKKNIDKTIKNNTKSDFKLDSSVENKIQVIQDTKEEEELQLGEFDDTFTWSAEVLAAQGKNIDQFSLDEIDWLSRLKQGLSLIHI